MLCNTIFNNVFKTGYDTKYELFRHDLAVGQRDYNYFHIVIYPRYLVRVLSKFVDYCLN